MLDCKTASHFFEYLMDQSGVYPFCVTDHITYVYRFGYTAGPAALSMTMSPAVRWKNRNISLRMDTLVFLLPPEDSQVCQ